MHLPAGKLRQRIVKLFGSRYNNILIPVEETTDVLHITGFVGKPEAAKKSRNEQFFFVNNRFIKSAYLHHALMSAYDDLLSAGQIPFYVIKLDLDPARIDVNVHPTKQEIKFADEKLIYNYLKATVRHGLGRASIMPTLDFEADNFFSPSRTTMRASDDLDVSQELPSKINAEAGAGAISGGGGRRQYDASTTSNESSRHASNLRHWEKLYQGLGGEQPTTTADSAFNLGGNEFDHDQGELLPSRASIDGEETPIISASPAPAVEARKPYQLHQRYIVSPLKSGFLLIDQQAAHERILYEDYLKQLRERQPRSQRSLFPVTLELPPADADLLKEILGELEDLGFVLEAFGGNSFIIHGIPAELAGKQSEQKLVEDLLEQYKANLELQLSGHERIARALARGAAVKKGEFLEPSVMGVLIDQLFACEQPRTSPFGRRSFVTFELDELNRRFES
ncbi:MAG: DNA mismatch repair endonuclease MutL [Bacteroidota bacterium]